MSGPGDGPPAGVAIIRQSTDDAQSGFLYRDGANRIIGVNSATSPTRQRFTIVHELGHLHLHKFEGLVVDHQIDNRNVRASLGIDTREIEANTFAAALLMPRDRVFEQVQTLLERPDIARRERLILALAKVFEVSSEAMGYRLINLGIYSEPRACLFDSTDAPPPPDVILLRSQSRRRRRRQRRNASPPCVSVATPVRREPEHARREPRSVAGGCSRVGAEKVVWARRPADTCTR